MNIIKVSLFIALIGFLSGCQTIEKATVDGRIIRNKSLGFNGYSVPMPTGYRIYDPIEQAGNNEFGDTINQMVPDISGPGYDIIDRLFMVDARRAISFRTFYVQGRYTFANFYEDSLDRMIGLTLEGVSDKKFTNVSRSVSRWESDNRKGDYPVGRHYGEWVIDGETYVCVTFITLGEMTDFYSFTGFAPKSKKSVQKVESDLEYMIRRIQF